MRKFITAILILFAGCLLFFAVSACRNGEERVETIELPQTPVLTAETQWGVIVSSHLRLREAPEIDSPVITTLWKGYVMEILTKGLSEEVVEGRKGFWYRVSYDGLQGWVFGAYLEIYSSREEAEAAAD